VARAAVPGTAGTGMPSAGRGRVLRAGRMVCPAGGAAGAAGSRPSRRAGLVAAVLACAGLLGLAACGSGGAAGHPDYELRVSAVGGLGRVLVDGSGYTLYIYVPDHRGRSVCYRVCARDWPPLLLPRGVRRAVADPGLNPALLGSVTRTGGSVQVTYNGWPLYLYDADLQPGQATGQADDMGLWYVLSPSGSVDRQPLPGQAGA
jgi:predicted lipoprotein with Yx(FWY)xxD motif